MDNHNPECPVCSGQKISSFAELLFLPVFSNLLQDSRKDALSAQTADISLAFCENCGHIFNLLFDPGLLDYRENYENSLDYSPFFQNYAQMIGSHLVEKYNLKNKHIIEIGCGNGKFLTFLCNLGGNYGTGFDVSKPLKMAIPQDTRVRFINDFYSPTYADMPVDFICCRHVLEHIHDPVFFLKNLRKIIGNRTIDTVVFFEVPNVLSIVRDLSVWDIIYEHPAYYSKHSLSCLFCRCGFEILNINEVYGGQFLTIEALPAVHSDPLAFVDDKEVKNLSELVNSFFCLYENKINHCKETLKRYHDAGKKTVVWGAGSKCVTFLNTLRAKAEVEYAIDINPAKQGKFIAGTGQKIMPPEFLRKCNANNVVILNELYRKEIMKSIDKLCGRARSHILAGGKPVPEGWPAAG